MPDNAAEEGFLKDQRIVIVGLGLMGGSLALALRGRCAALYGIDADPETAALARERQVVERASTGLGELLQLADLVVLAAPVRQILALLTQLPAFHPGPAIVIDLGSTKAEILRSMEALPARFDPVGGHPMCGKEVSGLANADPDLFYKAAFILSALTRTSAKARSLAVQLVEAVGARPVWLDGQVHDGWVAATSHLPYLLANSLAFCTPEEAACVVGPGFRSTARLAPSSPRMMRDILETNQAQILLALSHFTDRLSQAEGLIRQGKWEELERMFEQGADQYRRLVTAPAGGGQS